MKAKSRKRLLISSVAMLLVAMLALGTATFAWFTQNTTATANGINVKAVKSSNLVVSKVSGDTDWDSAINYGVGSSDSPVRFFPSSTTNGTDWVKAIAANSNASTKNSADPTSVTAPVMNNATSTSYAYLSMLNVKNDTETGGAAINHVTISWDALGNYARIALVPADSTGAALTTGEGVGFAANVYANDTTAYTAYGGAAVTTTATITPKNATSIDIGTLNAGEAKYYLLYVWFEGQDPDCKDTTAGQVINLNFTVTGTPEG